MIISSTQVQNMLKIYGKQTRTDNVRPREEVVPSGKADQVKISGEGKLMQKALQAVRQAEDVRKDKVEELKEAIASGTYNVTDEEVAEQMIYRALVDKLV